MMFEKLGVQAYTFREAYLGDDASVQTLEKAFQSLRQWDTMRYRQQALAK